MDKSLEIEQLIQKLPEMKFLVVGDLILDKYIWGDSKRISPEAPIPIVDIGKVEVRLGGAGNVANNLTNLGCDVRVASVIGDDHEGLELKRLLTQQGVSIAGVQCDSKRTTTCKTRIIASNQQMLRLDRENSFKIDRFQESQLIEFIQNVLPEINVVLISDYLKGVLTDQVLAEVIHLCDEADCPVIIDPKACDFSRYRGASLLTPNQKETELASGIIIKSVENLVSAGTCLQRDLGLDSLLITRGMDGMSLFTGGVPSHLPTEARNVYDVSGAGDTVLAFCAVGLAGGLSIYKSAELANIAAGIVVGKVGTSTVSPAEILMAAIGKNQNSHSKLLARERLITLLEGYHQLGKTIVFTNGCFDLLHAGHVKYLQRARKLGDLLVLGLNSDDSIRHLKGDKRPLLGQVERAQILAALDCVDYITIFEEDTPLELIRLIKPAILVKGGDYSADEVVGRNFVESYGGRLALLEFENGKSTTNIIDEVLTRYRD